MMSNTLVIHPEDETTACLKALYKDKDWDVISDIHTSDKEVREAIQSHDRIIMLGHGTPQGLLCSDGSDRFARYIIDTSHGELFKGKDTFSVWCNSDRYFRALGLHGFHTGMIISEVGEEWVVFGSAPLDDTEMRWNMEDFCRAVAEGIELTPEQCKAHILEQYNRLDAVTIYNRTNLFVL